MQGMNEPFLIDMPHSRLHVTAVRSRCERGQIPEVANTHIAVLDRDMFLLMWGPAIRAIAGILENAPPEDEATISEALRSIHLVRTSARVFNIE